jgi:Sec-independent protein translocase protein TatA
MANLHDAIRAINSSIVTIRDTTAYDKNEQVVQYDSAAAQAKLTELQAAETAAEQATATAKTSAISKLTALGLTSAEITALIG